MKTTHLSLLLLDSLEEDTKFSKEHYDDNWKLIDEAIGELKAQLSSSEGNGNNGHEVATLSEQISQLEKAQATLETKMAVATEVATEAKSQAEDAKNASETNATALSTMEQELASLKEKITEFQSGNTGESVDSDTLTELNGRISGLEALIFAYRKELSTVESTTNHNFTNLTSQWSNTLNEVNAKLVELETNVTAAQETADEAKGTAETVQISVEEINSTMESLKKRVDELENSAPSEPAEPSEDSGVDTAELDSLKEQIEEIESQLSKITATLGTQENGITNFESSLSVFQSNLSDLEAKVTALEAGGLSDEEKAEIASMVVAEPGAPGEPGEPGKAGDNGVGIVDAELDENGDLVFTMTDSTKTTPVPLPSATVEGQSVYPRVILTSAIGAIFTFSCGDFEINVTIEQVPQVVDLPDYGTWEVLGQKSGSANVTATLDVNVVKIYELEAEFAFSGTFAEAEVEDIIAVMESGLASEIWSIGDTKDILLETGETITIAIHGFDHDDKSDGTGKAPMTLGMVDCLGEVMAKNSAMTNVGSFTGSELYSWLIGTFWNAIPEEWRKIIVPVDKKTSEGNASTIIATESMFLFQYAEVEIYGTTIYSVSGEGVQYPYYTSSSVRIKRLANGSGNAWHWAFRSPQQGATKYFCGVGSSGSATYQGGSQTTGATFAFCVDAPQENEVA